MIRRGVSERHKLLVDCHRNREKNCRQSRSIGRWNFQSQPERVSEGPYVRILGKSGDADERRLSRHNPPRQQGSDQKFFTS